MMMTNINVFNVFSCKISVIIAILDDIITLVDMYKIINIIITDKILQSLDYNFERR